MRRLNLIRSGAFRLALIFTALFAFGALMLFGAVRIAVARYARTTTESAITGEIALLRGEADAQRLGSLAATIARRERVSGARRLFYLLADAGGVHGGLPADAARLGWHDARMAEPNDPDDEIKIRAFGVRLADGSLLVVGRDVDDLEELSEWLDRVTLWSGLGIVVLALGGGLIVASVFVRRLERVNNALASIMAGRLDERVPPIGMGAEYDRLTRTLNQMLDRIETLMDGLRQVSTDIAHDLRTPLTRLKQHLESARARTGPPAAADTAIDSALVQVDEVLDTFDALLRIGQIEGGVGRARFAPVDLGEIIERVRSAFEPTAEDAGKAVVVNAVPGLMVAGDRELLTQAFANLVENALTHAGEHATVTLGLARNDVGVIASVADNGRGIPASERDKVLRRFYRLDSSRATPGSGLGLSLIAAIAELHGAELQLSDSNPGLRVELRFPSLTEPRPTP